MTATDISREELQLAARNHGMPLEALRYAITPAGLHYLLIHYDVPDADEAEWELTVDGAVGRPLRLSLDDVRARPAVTMPVTLECAGNGRAHLEPRPHSQPWLLEAVGTAEWTGTRLRDLLDEAGPAAETVEVVFEGADRGVEGGAAQQYARSLPVDETRREDVLVVHTMNGRPLLPQHGFPLRLVVPGWYGMASVKWLRRITAVTQPFTGYQNAVAYRLRQSEDEPGEPLTRIEPRAIMIPPGIPGFPDRERYLDAGPCTVEGRAWSGWGPVTRVEFSTDAARTWAEAVLDPAPGAGAWHGWRFAWNPEPGTYVLCCRATDATGRSQPMHAQWNLGGYRNNAVQRVEVTVVAGP
jgi:sulfane dehydrogenase subunit SoxC